MSNSVAYSPLTDTEIFKRAEQTAAAYGLLSLFVSHLVTDPETSLDRSPRAVRLREERLVQLSTDAVVWQAAVEERLFNGNLTDWRRSADRLTAGAPALAGAR